MSESSAVGGRELRARYAFAGAVVALERTIPLVDGEEVLFHGVMRLRGLGLPRPAVLRVTSPRLVVLAHYAFQPDRVWDLPRAAVASVEMAGAAVKINWTDLRGVQQVLRLTRWSGQAALDKPIRDVGEAARVLKVWLASPNGGGLTSPGLNSHEP